MTGPIKYSEQEIKKALEHYLESFDGASGTLNVSNYIECTQWLEGFMIGANMSEISPLRRCIEVLRGAGHFVDWLNRHDRVKP